MRAPKLVRLVSPAWLIALALGSVAIAYGSLAYFNPDELPDFVIEKLPLPHEELWLFALKAHVIAAAFSLPACILLSLKVMLRFPRVHRWLGRTTGAVVLLALAPSGFYLSLFAKGGTPATGGFMLSGLIVVVAMAKGITTARAKDFVAHRRFALHVLAQLSVAVTSRAMLIAADRFGFDAEQAYLVSLWAPVVLSAVAVELLTRSTRRNTRHEAPAHVRTPRHGQPGLSVA